DEIARADLAARLLVIGHVQFDRAVELGPALFKRKYGEGVSGDVRLRHRDTAPDHPAVDDFCAVRVARPARSRRHHVAMGVEGNCRPPCPNRRRTIRLVAETIPLALTRFSGTLCRST